MSTFIVTTWNVGDVYVGNDRDKARTTHREQVRRVVEGLTHGDFPVTTWRNGAVVHETDGPKKYER